MTKNCKSPAPPGKICNPSSGRWVKKTGKIGKMLLGKRGKKNCKSPAPPGKICNPSSGRWVKKTGKIGKMLAAASPPRFWSEQKEASSPVRRKPKKPKKPKMPKPKIVNWSKKEKQSRANRKAAVMLALKKDTRRKGIGKMQGEGRKNIMKYIVNIGVNMPLEYSGKSWDDAVRKARSAAQDLPLTGGWLQPVIDSKGDIVYNSIFEMEGYETDGMAIVQANKESDYRSWSEIPFAVWSAMGQDDERYDIMIGDEGETEKRLLRVAAYGGGQRRGEPEKKVPTKVKQKFKKMWKTALDIFKWEKVKLRDDIIKKSGDNYLAQYGFDWDWHRVGQFAPFAPDNRWMADKISDFETTLFLNRGKAIDYLLNATGWKRWITDYE